MHRSCLAGCGLCSVTVPVRGGGEPSQTLCCRSVAADVAGATNPARLLRGRAAAVAAGVVV